ncbi:putative membrane protein YdjX (TVP38/TMEM64 family) [Evansella vedderi]|uniref:TVP38/TMEM64 family membrane protein n=1 Tax=Evansella vedderi TaxID=38282 RepID=A0ABT9ZVB0_9BACI|nr:TVP38/TMEM64 family protein [Evansella vedderi]MDQ0255180.1 putative membrane protein YdjX (TVP38/TMEM64 family) [Evansella vedderi]
MVNKEIWKPTIFIVVLLLLIWVNSTFIQITPEDIQGAMFSFGLLAPFIFILMYTLRPFILFPASIFAIAAGLSFGPMLGMVVTYIGSISGAILSFLAVRKLRISIVQKHWKGKGKHLQMRMEDNGFYYVLGLRIIPVINFDVVSYLSGLSKISFREYLGATMVGIIPGTIAFNFLGASLLRADWQMLLITALVFILAFIIPLFIRKVLEKKNIPIDFSRD